MLGCCGSINLSIVANETCTKRQLDNKSISTAIVLLQSEMCTGEGEGVEEGEGGKRFPHGGANKTN